MIRNQEELLDICVSIANENSWPEVAAALARFEEGLPESRVPGQPPIEVLVSWLFLIFSDHFEDRIGTAAGELYGRIRYREALDRALEFIQGVPSSIRTSPVETRASPALMSLVASIVEIAQNLGPNDLRITIFNRLLDIVPGLRRRILDWRNPPPPNPSALAGLIFAPASSGGPMPGDCIFRELSARALKDFGHVGIYLGSGKSEPIDNHGVLQMHGYRIGKPDCEIVTVADFKAAGGAFWGFYAVDLNISQRQALLTKALSYLSLCSYSVINYKNPTTMTFRCDGFVEHCYESVGLPASLKHRGGLFEDDTVLSLTPAGLRNAMFYKL